MGEKKKKGVKNKNSDSGHKKGDNGQKGTERNLTCFEKIGFQNPWALSLQKAWGGLKKTKHQKARKVGGTDG